MRDEQEITVGEVYRLIERQVLPTIAEIKNDVKAQNGRVSALEKDAVRIKSYWSAGAVAFAVFGNYLKGKLGL